MAFATAGIAAAVTLAHGGVSEQHSSEASDKEAPPLLLGAADGDLQDAEENFRIVHDAGEQRGSTSAG